MFESKICIITCEIKYQSMFFWKSKTIIGNGIFLRETVTLPESEDLRHILRSAWTKVPEFWRTAQAQWRQGSLQFHPKTSPVKKEALFYYFVWIYYKKFIIIHLQKYIFNFYFCLLYFSNSSHVFNFCISFADIAEWNN